MSPEPDLTAELDAAEDEPPKRPPGTSDVVVTSPSLAAPWDYGPGIDLDGAQFTPRLAPDRRRMTRNTPPPRLRPVTEPVLSALQGITPGEMIMPRAFTPLPVPLPVDSREPAPVIPGDGDQAGRVRQYGDSRCGHGCSPLVSRGGVQAGGCGGGTCYSRPALPAPRHSCHPATPTPHRPYTGRMSPGAWKLEPSMTGACRPGCLYYRMPGAPQHRHWLQQPARPRLPRPMGPVMRVLSRIWGES